jgi:hypothetical protein
MLEKNGGAFAPNAGINYASSTEKYGRQVMQK